MTERQGRRRVARQRYAYLITLSETFCLRRLVIPAASVVSFRETRYVKKLRVPVYTTVFQSISGLCIWNAVGLLSECQISFELGRAEATAVGVRKRLISDLV